MQDLSEKKSVTTTAILEEYHIMSGDSVDVEANS